MRRVAPLIVGIALMAGCGEPVATDATAGIQPPPVTADFVPPVPGTYNVQVRSQTGGPVSYTLTVTQTQAATPDAANLGPIETDYLDQNRRSVDFDGAFTIGWSGTGHETGFAVEVPADIQQSPIFRADPTRYSALS